MAGYGRVYIVETDDGVRRSLSHLLAGAGHDVATFESAPAFIELAPMLAPGCVLATVETPAPVGFSLAAALGIQRADLPVVIRSAVHGDVALAVRAIKAGAADFLDPSFSDAEVLAAVRAALEGLRLADAEERTAARIAQMPECERDVLRGLLAGGTNDTIGKRMGISPRTVEMHRAHMMERLGAHSLSEAVRMAVAAGLQPPPRDYRAALPARP